jgi:hypothetical protein
MNKAISLKRNHKVPSREDVLFITKHINSMPYHSIAKALNINKHTMLSWCKMVFEVDEKEKRYRAMEQHLDEMEMLENFDESLHSEYDIHSIRRIGLNNYYMVKRKIVNELRSYYMVTINHGTNYLVKFDTPVNRHSITYCPVSLGCDYEVNSIGNWEYNQLEGTLPLIEMQGDEHYIANFWLALSNLVIDEARGK